MFEAVNALWGAVGIVFIIGALTPRRVARRASRARLRWQALVLALAAWMLFFPPGIAALRIEIIHAPQTGFAIAVVALVGTLWARISLGDQWNAAPVALSGQKIVRAGPYAYVRHPVYAGLLLATVGTAAFSVTPAAVLAVGLSAYGLFLKARDEERLLRETNPEYAAYCRQVKALIPLVW